jgi:multiple sugar transport system permease protein
MKIMANALEAAPQTASTPVRRKMSSIMQHEIKWGVLFLSPWLIGLIAFTALPILISLVFSFTDFDPIHPENASFVGLRNYALLFSDPGLSKAVRVTLFFASISIPLSIIIPLGIAVLVNSERLFGKNVFRSLFYLPTMIPIVVSVMVWQGVLNSDSGWVNTFLKTAFNIQGPHWFQDEFWVIPAITIMGIWGLGSTMLTMLAGLQNVPTELYEAATVDGANGVQKFFLVTLPMISPVIFYNLILAVIGAFQTFVPGYIIGNGRGDPNGATLFYNLFLYQEGWNFQNMGYAATLAWMMFIVVLLLTVLLFWGQRRWVYYGGGE